MVDCISFVHTKIYPLARNLKQRMNKNEPIGEQDA